MRVMMMAPQSRLSGAVFEVGEFRCRHRRKKAWICAAWSHYEAGERQHFSSTENHHPDHYTLLGISSDATPQDIKLAFRQLARKYHPDVNPDSGAAEVFKTVCVAYETLSDKTNRLAYDHSLRVQAHVARRTVHKNYQCSSMYARKNLGCFKKGKASHWKYVADEDLWETNSTGSVGGLGESGKRTGRDFGFEEDSDMRAKHGGLHLCPGWENSMVDVLIVFCLVGFIWHALGVQLALTYFVFFIPHNKEHTVWYRFASVMAFLIGGTKGLALQYGIVTTGWLYGKGHDMMLAMVLSAIWMEAHILHAFSVPRGAILLMAHICLDGFGLH